MFISPSEKWEFEKEKNTMQDYSHKNKPLTGSVASELILEIFDGQTRVPTKKIREKVTELHISRGGLPKTTGTTLPVTHGLIRLRKQGKAKNLKKGFWTINRTRQNTKLESEGAEFLVLGQLLIQKINTYKAYMNMPGYDLVATYPENNTSARIQVKSRWATGAREFIIRSFDCDFVVFVRLNRGKNDGTGEVHLPEYFVFPVAVVKGIPTDKLGQLRINRIKDFENYRDRWDLIGDFLNVPHAACDETSVEG